MYVTLLILYARLCKEGENGYSTATVEPMTQNAAHNLHNCESLMSPKLFIQILVTPYLSVNMYTSNISDQHAYNKYVTVCHHYPINGDSCSCWSSKMKYCGVTAH